jgi:hypothetical protein
MNDINIDATEESSPVHTIPTLVLLCVLLLVLRRAGCVE